MEKFTVDLDKVLDDFEFNEDKAEQLASVVPKKQPTQPIGRVKQVLTPYRRPQFEPINMAEADFAAAPEKSFQSNWQTNNKPVETTQQTWRVKNSEPTDEEMDSDEDSDIEADDSYKIPVPKNLNESLNFYQNNSFQDEFLENKPITVSRPISFPEQDTKWQPKSQNIHDSSDSFSSVKSNASVGAVSVNDNVNSGVKVIVKDVKTVSNNLSSNKYTNRDKSAVTESRTSVESEPERNLPDVASTSTSKAAFQNVSASVPNNTTFDLVTNICNEQDQSFYEDATLPAYLSSTKPVVEPLTVVSSLETSEDEYEPESNQSHVFKPYETRVPSTSLNVDHDRKTESSSDDGEYDSSLVAESSQNVDFAPAAVVPAAVSFGDVDHLSDSDLLNYLQEIEDEEKIGKESTAKDDVPSDKVVENRKESLTDNREGSGVSEIPSIVAVVNDPVEEAVPEVVESRTEREVEATVERRTTSNMLKDIVFEMSLPECSRQLVDETEVTVGPSAVESTTDARPLVEQEVVVQPGPEMSAAEADPEGIRQVIVSEENIPDVRSSEPEDSSPEDEESMDNNRPYVAISAETGSVIELTPDVDRPGLAVDEVRTPMIQTARDGDNIHVLGEEERPTRPKYLLLSNVANAMEETTAAVGPAGSTPSAYTATNINAINQNLINANLDNVSVANVTADNQTFEPVATEAAPGDSSAELLDNMINANTIANEPDAYSPPPGSVLTPEERSLGKLPPFWIPDNDAVLCMLCEVKFTVLKRRHHCRACGKVLCGKCCGLRFRLEYMENTEGRVCQPCHDVLLKVLLDEQGSPAGPGAPPDAPRQPHPNNPMDYCSVIPPEQQEAAAGGGRRQPACVLVPALKREGSTRPRGEAVKQVMFSDGIRPGGDLTELDGSAEPRVPFRRPGRVAKRVATPPGPNSPSAVVSRTLPALNPKTLSYLPLDKGLPPTAAIVKGELKLDDDVLTQEQLLTRLQSDEEPPVMFAVNRNLFVTVKILNLSCCVNRTCWCFSTRGLSCVGQDEVMLILEKPEQETALPADIFSYFNTLYQDAVRGSTVSELGCTLLTGPFLGSNDHGAFIYIRPSFQCLNQLILPSPPYLVAILVHRSETPWARVFPIRLMLRLGAEFRYYPCSLVSVRQRKPVYREIGHTIVNLLADFRNLTYTLPAVRGLVIHMEDKHTAVLVPRNRYDQVTRALNNSNEHVLAFAANLSLTADSHLVCVQSDNDDSYHTQAINIHSKPRKVTGASFVVFNGALKTSSNLTAKSSIVEDGLMVQITPDTMLALRAALRNMKETSIGCGPTGADSPDEVVTVRWVDDDKHFNVGVASVIDARSLDGVPSIRVHNGTDYLGRCRLIRWTEVFILQSDEAGSRTEDPLDVGRLSESVARATCVALVKLLDLLAAADYTKLAVRATIHPDNVGYEVGSRGEKLPPIYMNSLDNELVPVLHAAAASSGHTDAILELVFHVLLQ